MTNALTFFDCNTYLGQAAVPKFFPRRVTTAELLGEMDRIGVAQALVTHIAAKEYSPAHGNDLLTGELADGGSAARLAPCLTLLPEHTGELWEPEVLLDQLRRRHACCVRLFPSATVHRYPFDRRVLSGLFDVLAPARVPVLVDFDLGRRDEADWRGLYDLADAYPELPFVLIRPGGRSDRGLYPLLRRCANVSIETGGYWVHRGLERISERFGADRLVFGSGFPYWTMSGAAYHVATARVSDEERAAIAGGNLRRLLEGVRL
jgi:hypothetical protein